MTLSPDQARTVHRGLRYRLALTSEQEARLDGWVGVVRMTYNLALEQRRDFSRQYRRTTGKYISFFSQSGELKDLRAVYDWVADAPHNALQLALKDLDLAFQAFRAGRAAYPTPRKRGLHDSIRFRVGAIEVAPLNRRWAQALLPKIGWVKFRLTRPVAGELRTVTISRVAGEWFIAFIVRQDAAHPISAAEVGIDRGIARTVTLSTGEHFNTPDQTRLNERLKRARRRLARMKMGSGRRAVQRARLSDLSARGARIRSDWCHRTSTDVAKRFGLVAIERLDVKNMTASPAKMSEKPRRGIAQKRGLNRSILQQSWGTFASQLAYKLEERGGTLIRVSAAYTSQTCALCGVVDARSRKSQAIFECVACGHADNADVNAAREILRRGTSGLDVEAGVARPKKRQPKEVHHV